MHVVPQNVFEPFELKIDITPHNDRRKKPKKKKKKKKRATRADLPGLGRGPWREQQQQSPV